jgi:hypothetical protein
VNAKKFSKQLKKARRWLRKKGPVLGIEILIASPVLILLGAILNQIAVVTNHGLMPVMVPGGCMPGTSDGVGHICMTPATHLKFLCDWIQLRIGTASIGDTLIWFGYWLWYPAITAWVVLMTERLRNARQ